MRNREVDRMRVQLSNQHLLTVKKLLWQSQNVQKIDKENSLKKNRNLAQIERDNIRMDPTRSKTQGTGCSLKANKNIG